MPPSAVRAPYVRYEDTNFDIHPKTAIAQNKSPPKGGLGSLGPIME
jgi:hypothetical protein